MHVVSYYLVNAGEPVQLPESNEVWTDSNLLKVTVSVVDITDAVTAVQNFVVQVLHARIGFIYLASDILLMSTKDFSTSWPGGIIEIEI